MKKVFCFGELLLRMAPFLEGKWIAAANMPVFVGGAELNVATALQQWGVPAKYVTALPENYLSREICDTIEKRQIDISSIIFTGKRIGVYYLPQGSDFKKQGVIYDRDYSSFSALKPGMLDWENLLSGCGCFHFSAISPALNSEVAAVCKEGLEVAVRLGLKISVDLNYRAQLWQYGKDSSEVMPELVQYCDVIMGNVWAVEKMLAIPMQAADREKEIFLKEATRLSEIVMQKFPKCSSIANTFRFEPEDGIHYYAVLNDRQGQHVSKEFKAKSFVDKVGSGDCFMAGLIYGLYNGLAAGEIINFAAAAAFGKLQELGDSTRQDSDQVKKIYK